MRMALKFAANLSFMFQDTSNLLERYARAKKCGFRFVECANPYQFKVEEVVEAKESNGLSQVLINIPVDEKLGVAANPDQFQQFHQDLDKAIVYANALRCPTIHIMGGKFTEHGLKAQEAAYRKSLESAIPKLEKHNLTAVIEPINPVSVPNYFLNSFAKAVEIVSDLKSPNIRLLCDIFHLQQTGGNLTASIRNNFNLIGHFQIAQVPTRHEPDTPGEIDYLYMLKYIDSLQYDKYIGLEYSPKSNTEQGLKWITQYGFSL